jgi:hypothetical protein
MNTPVQHPLFRSGLDVSSASTGFCFIDTGFVRKVEHFSLSFLDSAGKDEAKYDWVEVSPGQVKVSILKAAGTAADTAVNFSWFATGF